MIEETQKNVMFDTISVLCFIIVHFKNISDWAIKQTYVLARVPLLSPKVTVISQPNPPTGRKVLSHGIRVCTGNSVLYFNTHPASVFQIILI